ncbi:hypothetical protein GLYMA_04G195800v4 [Glycine max]|uniref:Uncharacterized protein n=1 Tax=Glycine max TaxID=3847 RepID=A0A0R0KAA7_SOYBN|nr:hypothetical protein JHK85_011089 [Glycine max]KAG5067048.1 hypothetical protein JHK86_010779 [Glycine max]KAH1112181.1 hypothetical protein GYH30_010486 [Glycine max]KRH63767.1 hypothetical protein GLYMA_04G195800v4 [Glycine max]
MVLIIISSMSFLCLNLSPKGTTPMIPLTTLISLINRSLDMKVFVFWFAKNNDILLIMTRLIPDPYRK